MHYHENTDYGYERPRTISAWFWTGYYFVESAFLVLLGLGMWIVSKL